MRRSFINCILLLSLLATSIVYAADKQKPDKIRVKSVEFENNSVFSDRTLRNIMLNRPSTLFLPITFNKQLLQQDLKQVELFYHQNGYLEARIEDYDITVDSLKRKAYIRIKMVEGELTIIEGFTIFGNSAFSDSTLARLLDFSISDPLKKKRLDNSVNNMINLYADRGYIEAKVNTELRVNSDLHRAFIDFIIRENNRYSVGDIRIKGLSITKSIVVERDLLFKSGEIINNGRILKSQRNLYLTGLFKSVYIRLQPSTLDKHKDVLIEIKENPHREFAASLGYGSIDKLRSRLELTNINLYGTARKAGINGRISFIGRGLETTFTEPRTFSTRWKTDVSLKTEFQDEPGYDIYTSGGTISVGRSAFEKLKVVFSLRYEDNNLQNIELAEAPANINTRIRSIGNSLSWDSRDNLFNPRKGFYFELINELAGLIYNGRNNFARSVVRLKKFVPWKDRIVFGTAIELGMMRAKRGDLESIPFNERFYTGGPNSLRGFKYRMAGPLDANRKPLGGRLKLVFNAFEIRAKIYKMINGCIFLDLGNVWYKPEDFSTASIRMSPGIGLRIDTPIGLGRIDYGFNPYRKTGEKPGMLYISVGQAF